MFKNTLTTCLTMVLSTCITLHAATKSMPATRGQSNVASQASATVSATNNSPTAKVSSAMDQNGVSKFHIAQSLQLIYKNSNTASLRATQCRKASNTQACWSLIDDWTKTDNPTADYNAGMLAKYPNAGLKQIISAIVTQQKTDRTNKVANAKTTK